MARGTKPGWCCCCRRPDPHACGGRPQSKSFWNRRIHFRSASLWCGSLSCQQIGRDPVGWCNAEFQAHGFSSIGITTILSLESCAISFPRSRAAASARACFGTWLCSMGSKRNGAILRLCLLMDRSWMQRLFLKRRLPGFQTGREIENGQ